MIYIMYSVFDTIDSCYGDILLHRSDARAARTLTEMIKNRNEQLKTKGLCQVNINELKLRRLGTFDDTTGKIEPLANPEEIPLTE